MVSMLNAQDLANTVWAFAKPDQVDEALSTALAGAVTPRLGDSNAQYFAKTAWVFAKADQLDD